MIVICLWKNGVCDQGYIENIMHALKMLIALNFDTKDDLFWAERRDKSKDESRKL